MTSSPAIESQGLTAPGKVFKAQARWHPRLPPLLHVHHPALGDPTDKTLILRNPTSPRLAWRKQQKGRNTIADQDVGNVEAKRTTTKRYRLTHGITVWGILQSQGRPDIGGNFLFLQLIMLVMKLVLIIQSGC